MNRSFKQKVMQKVASILLIAGTTICPVHATSIENATATKASFKSSALVTKSEINADCLIKSGCSEVMRGELAGIQLGHIPDPLGELIIEEKELRKKLGKFADGLKLPGKVVIKRQGAILKGSDIGKRIKALCMANSDQNLEIDVSRIPNNIVLPGNLIDLEIIPNSDNLLGMRLFYLTARTDGGNFRQLIQVSVVKMIEAAQLTRLSRPGEVISKEMIGKKIVKVKSEQANMPLTYEEAMGKCLGRFKSPGTILRSSDLSKGANNVCIEKFKRNNNIKVGSNVAPRNTRSANKRANWVIKPGEKVNYHFSNGTLELTFPARAVSGGEVGDSITLINLKNQRKIEGIVTDKGQVEYAKK